MKVMRCPDQETRDRALEVIRRSKALANHVANTGEFKFKTQIDRKLPANTVEIVVGPTDKRRVDIGDFLPELD